MEINTNIFDKSGEQTQQVFLRFSAQADIFETLEIRYKSIHSEKLHVSLQSHQIS